MREDRGRRTVVFSGRVRESTEVFSIARWSGHPGAQAHESSRRICGRLAQRYGERHMLRAMSNQA